MRRNSYFSRTATYFPRMLLGASLLLYACGGSVGPTQDYRQRDAGAPFDPAAVTQIVVSDAKESARFATNGEITDELEDGETDVPRSYPEIDFRVPSKGPFDTPHIPVVPRSRDVSIDAGFR